MQFATRSHLSEQEKKNESGTNSRVSLSGADIAVGRQSNSARAGFGSRSDFI
jgi:hypothetical protein